MISIAGFEASAPDKEMASALDTDADPSQDAILRAVRTGSSEIEDVARSTKLSPRDFAIALSALELNGQLLVSSGGAVTLTGRT